MGFETRCIRMVVRLVVGMGGLGFAGAAASAGTSPVSLVSFQWGCNASGSAGVSLSCEQGCAPLSECNNQPVTSFSLGGNQMVNTLENPQVGRNCGGSCGGAGIASSFFQANGGARVDAPSVSPGYVLWGYSSSVSGQVGAGAGIGCGTSSTSCSVAGSHFCDMVFDTGPGDTVVTLVYQHYVNGEHASTSSVWTIGNESTTFLSQSLNAANGADFNVGQVTKVLPAGRYHLRLDGSLSESAVAQSLSSQSFTTAAGVEFSISFQPYVCASVTTQPQPLSVCPSGTGQFTALGAGTGPLGQRWQWQQTGAPGVWTDIHEGPNTDSGGVVRFIGSGVTGPIVQVTRDPSPFGAVDVIQAVRCVLTNACGDVPSNAAAVNVCRGDLNCDAAVNTADLVAFLGQFGSSSPSGTGADINHDGVVNTVDLTQFLGGFGRACP
jgi:hypothetical protein